MLVLDTHVLIWLVSEEHKIGVRSRRILDESWSLGDAAVSAMTFWEISMLLNKRRVTLSDNPTQWRLGLIEQGLNEIPIDGQIGIRATLLPNFHADPADRIIVATALEGRHSLMTADESILRWDSVLPRVDARE